MPGKCKQSTEFLNLAPKTLNKHEIAYLLESGYYGFTHPSIITGKREKCLLKPRHNESLRHMFFTYAIAEFLESKGIHYNLFTTKMPDVVFSANRKRVAIEVETGTVMTNMKKFREKLRLLNQNYKDNWYFVVTNRKLIKKYRTFGKVIDPRFIKFNLNKIIKNA